MPIIIVIFSFTLYISSRRDYVAVTKNTDNIALGMKVYWKLDSRKLFLERENYT